jgi:hypothetical protein
MDPSDYFTNWNEHQQDIFQYVEQRDERLAVTAP